MKWFPWFRGREKGVQITASTPPQEEFLWLEGRRHSKDLPYVMPTDIQELNRQDFQHYLIRYVMQCNYIAPIQEPKGILDVGTGSGRWAREMAMAFPQAKVFGLDVSGDSGQQESGGLSNYRFTRGDILKELPFPDMTFDFVHQRFLHMAIPATRWQSVIEELKRVTRPGGWIELAESDLIMHNPGPAMKQLSIWGLETSRKRGIDPGVCTQIGDFLNVAGIKNIQMYKVDLPIGIWAGRVGKMTATNLYAYNRAIKPMMVAQMGVNPDIYDRLSEAMRNEWERNRSFFSFYIACGQRPF